MIRTVRDVESEKDEYLRMRKTLWPHACEDEHVEDIHNMVNGIPFYEDEITWKVYVVERPGGRLGGFIEISLRPSVSFAVSTPVAYVEGWYVDAEHRKQGDGRLLMEAAEIWALEKGCRELVSDVEVENVRSHQAHKALGFKEAFRNDEEVYYKKIVKGSD
ncbi:GNAT family N-acetyltransferase [Halobacillus litoralis]|uniref:GNAT family N-acetyltransferase n=1 Tax=Halobacillus litoralis TaxID=45668 RepID=UPI001CD3028F|nr:GNAT family N-acetyltransferase [Halobacillus litoralis]MCA0971701.1 GNAT family N-acetyltransferase [Halobacillus litoralis]